MQRTATSEDLLTSPQTALELGVSIRTVHRLADDGVLPLVHKLPGPHGAFLFHRSDVEALRAEREGSAA
jgi:predicted DNA-binding transcriptional regulator AlpA